jgi:hypothetical protein
MVNESEEQHVLLGILGCLRGYVQYFISVIQGVLVFIRDGFLDGKLVAIPYDTRCQDQMYQRAFSFSNLNLHSLVRVYLYVSSLRHGVYR